MTEESVGRYGDLVTAMLEHLEHGTPRPCLDHLDPAERDEAAGMLSLLEITWGAGSPDMPAPEDDPVALALGLASTAPSSSAAAAAAALPPAPDEGPLLEVDDDRNRMLRRVARLLGRLGLAVTVVRDVESRSVAFGAAGQGPSAPVPADLAVTHLDIRISVCLQADFTDARELTPARLLQAAASLLRHWPEISAVALVANDAELSTQVVDPYESSEAIGVPSGTRRGPRPARPTLPLIEAFRGYLEDVLPTWEGADLGPLQETPVDVAAIALDAALAALRRLDDESSRARIPEKRAAFSSLGAEHAQRLAVLVEQVQQGRLRGASAFEWSDRIDALLEVAS